jgi:hypothetical protein
VQVNINKKEEDMCNNMILNTMTATLWASIIFSWIIKWWATKRATKHKAQSPVGPHTLSETLRLSISEKDGMYGIALFRPYEDAHFQIQFDPTKQVQFVSNGQLMYLEEFNGARIAFSIVTIGRSEPTSQKYEYILPSRKF